MCMKCPPYLPLSLFFISSLFTSVRSVHHDAAMLTRRALPEIGGSTGGFIGLVVALAVLTLICCIGVFFLLTHREPSDQDRAARRERYRRHREREQLNMGAPSLGLSVLRDKIHGIWGKRPTNGNGSRNRSGGRRGGRGWIQAGSGDEWETNSDRDEERAMQQPMQPFSMPSQEEGHGTYVAAQTPEIDSPLSDTYADPYVKGSSSSQANSPPRVSFVRSHSPLALPFPLPSSGSPIYPGDEEEEGVQPPDHHHSSTQSSTPVRNFEGGTKFIESF